METLSIDTRQARQSSSLHHELFHFHFSFWVYKMEYLDNEKNVLNEIKNIFHSFWRAIIWWKNKNLIKIADTRFRCTSNILELYFQSIFEVNFKYKPGSHLWSRRRRRSRSRSRGRSRRRRKHSVNICEVSEARVKYEASNETRISKFFDIKIGLASHLLHDFCNVNAWSNFTR